MLKTAGLHLRHLMAEAQSDPQVHVALLHRLIEPRRDALQQLLVERFPDAKTREAAVMAIYGATWYRLLLDEPLDAPFARDLAALSSRPILPPSGPCPVDRQRGATDVPSVWTTEEGNQSTHVRVFDEPP